MKKLDYDKFLNANERIGVFCRTPEEMRMFGTQMCIRHKGTITTRLCCIEPSNSFTNYFPEGIVFLNNGEDGSLREWENRINIYDFTTGKVVSWKRGTKRPNDYYYHKDVVDYKDYIFENQLYHISYYRNEPELRTKFMDIKHDVIGYIDNFNPSDKIAIRDKNNLLYCIDYQLITLIEPIKEEK